MAAANYYLCDKCKAKTYYDADVDYEDSNLGAMAALCKDCAQVYEITIAQRDAIAELRAALRTLVTDLEALMEESHLSLYDGDGALVDTSWGKVLQGGKDAYLSNWRDAKRLAGGENEK